MSDSLFGKEERYASKLIKEYPFLRKMWQEREKVDLPPKKWTQRRVGVSIGAGS